MTLVNLIRKRDTTKFATAIPAISAIQKGQPIGTVARIATVAVANFAEWKTAFPQENGALATSSHWWLLRYSECDPEEVACYPEATHAEILERHPDAIAAEPFTPTVRQPSSPMISDEAQAIRRWLALLEETDPATIADVLNRCRTDADARTYFLWRADEAHQHDGIEDDRRRCRQCANLTERGLCLAVRRGEISAAHGYEPIRDLRRRCEGYVPGPKDPDRRLGLERWPGLTQQGSGGAGPPGQGR